MMMWAAALGREAEWVLVGPALTTLGAFVLDSPVFCVADTTLAEAGRGRCAVVLVPESDEKLTHMNANPCTLSDHSGYEGNHCAHA